MGGDAPAPTQQESTRDMLAALTAYMPELTTAYNKALPDLERGAMATRQEIAPQEAQLSYDLYKLFGPAVNEVGQGIYKSNQTAQAKTDAEILQGPGKELTRAALENSRIADPEYYRTREATADSYTKLLGSLDPTSLSAGEMASTERALNRANQQAGLTSAPSRQAGIRNALAYDDRMTAKKGMLSQALTNAPGVAQATKSGVDPYMMATGKTSYPQLGASALTGTSPAGFGQSASNLTGGMLSELGQNSRNSANINANRRDELDRFNESFSSIVGSV